MQLERALYDVEDLMARIATPFVLAKHTAMDVYDEKPLAGSSVEIVIRRNEFLPEKRSTLQTLQPNLDITKDGFSYEWEGVPINVTFVEQDNPFFKNVDSKWHQAWEYFIPNPFNEYRKALL